jgi:hypothetical protein
MVLDSTAISAGYPANVECSVPENAGQLGAKSNDFET